MKKYTPLLFGAALLFAAACKKEPCDFVCQSLKKDNPYFNFDKGWKLLASIGCDLGFNSQFNECVDIDFGGRNGNLRCYYYQAWRDQQSNTIYSNVRLDEVDTDRQLVGRTECDMEQQGMNDGNRNFFLHNGKRTFFVDYSSNWTPYLQIYEDGVLRTDERMSSEATDPIIADEAIYFPTSYHDGTRLAFTLKRYAAGAWEYYGSYGYYYRAPSWVLGGEKINNTPYMILGGFTALSDSIVLAMFSIDTTNAAGWVNVCEQTFPCSNLGGSMFYYFPNGNTPIILVATNSDLTTYQANPLQQTFTVQQKSTISTNISQPVLCDGEIHFVTSTNGLSGVSKLSNNSLIPVGSAGFFKGINIGKLLSRNNKLYAIAEAGFDRFYVATPE